VRRKFIEADKVSKKSRYSGSLGLYAKFLDNPEIPIDNNSVENGIRPFVIGRKNWLFADAQSGLMWCIILYAH